jgi:autotransporter-associated beta strand protein
MKKILLVNFKLSRLFVTVIVMLLSQVVVLNCWGQTSYTSTAVSTAWNASRWNNAADGPTYASTYTANQPVSFTSGTYTFAGMGATINVGNIDVASGVTVSFASIANTFATNGTVRTITVGSGGLFDLSTNTISTTSGTGFIKSGTGAFAFSGSAYNGGFTLSSGTIVLRGINALGAGVVNFNGGVVAANANRAVVAPTAINIGGDVQFGEVPANVSLASNTATLSFSTNVDLGGVTRTFTLGNAASTTFSGIISNGGLSVGANANGTSGILILSGANTFSSGLTINSGTLRINNYAALGATSGTFIINGGTIQTTNAGGGGFFSSTNNPITIGGNFSVSGSLPLGMGTGAVSLGNSTTRTITSTLTSSQYISFQGAISGTGSALNVTTNDAGNMLFSGNNTFDGGMTLDGTSTGRASFGAANAFPTSGTITINNSGGFRLTAGSSPSYGSIGQSIICNPNQT